MKEPIRVLIVDDHQIILDAFIQAARLPQNRDIEISFTAGTEKEALRVLQTQDFDVAVIDIRLPPDYGKPGDNEAGLRVIKAISEKEQAPKVLGISGVIVAPEFIVRVIRSGADGYVLKKGSKLDEVFDAVRSVHQGGKVYPSEIVQFVVDTEATWLQLTEREQEIWRLIAEGLTNQDIADELSLSIDTVKRYASELYSKIRVSNRAQATRKWLEEQYGLIEIKPSEQ